jgi:DNA invertase Pin-like site-specific DNA recombinase
MVLDLGRSNGIRLLFMYCNKGLTEQSCPRYTCAMNKKTVAYYRVSTQAQGKSGLGLEAQKATVEAYRDRNGCNMIPEYTEIESGKRDSLTNRPQLVKAIAHARRSKAVLVIAKMDRLTRSVYVTAELHRSGVEFVACDNPHANRMTVQILAAVAENEARMISERTSSALQALKARGVLLGASRPECRNLTQGAREKGSVAGGKATHERSLEAYTDLRDSIAQMRVDGLSLRAIATTLNGQGESTRTGKAWNPVQVSRVLALP